MPSELPQFDSHGRTLPSWLLSACAHLALLVLLALGVRSPRARGMPERVRDVGIALTRVGEGRIEYLDDSGIAADSAATPQAHQVPDSPQITLPDAAVLAEIALPRVTLPGAAVALPTEGLIAEIDYAPVRRGVLPSAGDIEAARAEDARDRQRRPGRGPVTEVSLFGGTAAIGNSFVFVIDRSDSMGRGGLGVISRTRREFEKALASLQPVHQFQIVAYNHQLAFFGGGRELVPASESNKRLIGKFMSGLAAFGATNHFSAIMSALHRSPDVVYLLTDGGDPVLSHPQMVQVLKQARGRTTIHCVQFGRRSPDDQDSFMHRLARETGGSYRYVNVSRSK